MTTERTRRSRRARQPAFPASDWPDAIELVVVAIRAGLTPRSAFDHARTACSAPIASAFGEVAHRCERGERFADAVQALPERLGPSAASVADGLAAVDRYGLAVGPVLDRLAADVRADRARITAQRARSLSVTMSFPLVVCTLPAFALLAVVPAMLGALASLRQLSP